MLAKTRYFQDYQGFSSNTWSVMVVFLLYAFAWPVITFMPLYLRNTLHYSLLQTGLSTGIYGVGFVVASFFGAALCDRFSAYRVTVTANLCFLLFLVLLFWIHGPYPVVLTLLVLLGMSNATFSPAARMLMMRSVSAADQMRANSLRYMLFNLGTAAAFGLAGLLIQGHYARVFIFSAVCAILIAIFLWLWCKPDSVNATAKTTAKISRWPNRAYVVILSCFFLGMLVLSQLNSTYSLFLTEHYHLSIDRLSLLFLLNSLLVALVQMPLMARVKNLAPASVMNVGGVVMGVGFFLLLFGTGYWLAIFSMVVFTVGEMLFMPVSQTLSYQAAPDNAKGYYMGLYQAVYASTLVFSPLLGTLALNVKANGLWLWSGCLLLCCLPLAAGLIKNRKG